MRKFLLFGVIGSSLAIFSWSRADSSPLLTCEAKAHKILYEVYRSGTQYELVRRDESREIARLALRGYGAVVGYDGTYLFYENQGRSGYLLIYYHKGTPGRSADQVLLDIDLFQEPLHPLNTEGPSNDFTCHL